MLYKERIGDAYPRVPDSIQLLKVTGECNVSELMALAVVELCSKHPVEWRKGEEKDFNGLSMTEYLWLVKGRQRSIRRLGPTAVIWIRPSTAHWPLTLWRGNHYFWSWMLFVARFF
jgi:hypothetical protein